MAADLRATTGLGRLHLLLDGDALVVLQPQSGSDKVRRIYLDQVESVAVWRRPAWGGMALVLVVLATTGGLSIVAAASAGPAMAVVVAGIVFASASAFMAWYIVCGRTTIRVTRAGFAHDFHVVERPSRVRVFIGRLHDQIRETQATAARRAASHARERLEGALIQLGALPADGHQNLRAPPSV